MRCVFFAVNVFISTSFADINDDFDLFKAVDKRVSQIGAQPLQEVRDHEKTIRKPFDEKRALLQKQIDEWNILLKDQSDRMKIWMTQANAAATACVKEKKDTLVARPEFVFLQMEIEALEEKILLVKQDPFFQNKLETVREDHLQRLNAAIQALNVRLAESAHNREHGLAWSLNDGRYHQEDVANISWERPTDWVKHIFGLSKMEIALNEAKVYYDRMLCEKMGGAYYYKGGNDADYGGLKFEREEEGRSYITKLKEQIIRIDREEFIALEDVRNTHLQLMTGLRTEATRQLLEENDKENEAMENILTWLEEFSG